MSNWKSALKADPIPWLLEPDNPSVRYWTLRDLLDAIVRRFPPLADQLLTPAGRLSGHVNVFIDGRGAPYLHDGLDTVLRADQKVDIFPAVAGG